MTSPPMPPYKRCAYCKALGVSTLYATEAELQATLREKGWHVNVFSEWVCQACTERIQGKQFPLLDLEYWRDRKG